VHLTLASGAVLLVWRSSGAGVAAYVADMDHVDEMWLAEINRAHGSRVALVTPGGDAVPGSAPPGAHPAIRLAASTRLPWTLQVTRSADERTAALGSRRRLLVAGLTLLGLFVVAGAWFIDRAIARELAVAGLQADFVSAVSHEFRTPLTTLCQLSELLARDRVVSESDRRQYHLYLHNESLRLRRLVEALLDFGRLEAGKQPFRFEPVDAVLLVRRVVDEFRLAEPAKGHGLEVEMRADEAWIRADHELLRTALWNLFENAAKYSPGREVIWVRLERLDTHVSIAVCDRGVGIPRHEQRQIFDKFVRGSGARASGVGGTGIGLATVQRIIAGHDGEIAVESEPDEGSTFTLRIPLLPDAGGRHRPSSAA
jgi:signal transduction histidine kinase